MQILAKYKTTATKLSGHHIYHYRTTYIIHLLSTKIKYIQLDLYIELH